MNDSCTLLPMTVSTSWSISIGQYTGNEYLPVLKAMHFSTRHGAIIIYSLQYFLHRYHRRLSSRAPMPENITPEKAIAFTYYIVALTFCWPPSPSATKFQVFQFKLCRFCLILNCCLLVFPLFYSIYLHRDDPESVAKSACLNIALVQTVIQTSYFVTQYERVQRLIEEMRAYCEKASPDERNVLQKYVNKYYLFCEIAGIAFYVTVIVVILGTLFTSDLFPSNAEYPFPVEYEPVRSIIFVHQSFAGMQCAAHACVSIFCALLLLFSAARFKILMDELRAVKDLGELVEGLKKYHKLKRYADEVVKGFRFAVTLTVLFCLVIAVFSGISFILQRSQTMNFQFAFMVGSAFMEVFICAWPADHLLDISTNVMDAVYESEWQWRPLQMQKTLLLAILPVSPVAIKVTCLIPTFSLNYYCSYVSNVFSMFTTLRVMLVKEED